MSLSKPLLERCESKCELCASTETLSAYTVPPKTTEEVDHQIAVCSNCLTQIEDPEQMDANHWRCLNDSMWAPVPAIQVVAYRLLNRLNAEGWAQDALGMIYLDEATMEWAQTDGGDSKIVHKDSNGNILQAGDSVTLIQDLNVKGANFTAKRGTAVRRIRLDPDNAAHIEGKVDGQQIVILTKYVKKSN